MADSPQPDPTTNGSEPKQLMELPPGMDRSGLERISASIKRLNEDLREWVELRIQLLKMELTETAVQKVGSLIIMAVLGWFSLTFFLLSAAIGLGMLLDNMFFGFGIITVVLILGLVVMATVKPTLYRAKVPKKKFEKPARSADARSTSPAP